MFKLNYSSFSKEELAMWDRSSVPNNIEIIKCSDKGKLSTMDYTNVYEIFLQF